MLGNQESLNSGLLVVSKILVNSKVSEAIHSVCVNKPLKASVVL